MGSPLQGGKLACKHEWCAACNICTRRRLSGCRAGIGSEGELPGDKDGDLAPREQSHSPAPIRAGKPAFTLSPSHQQALSMDGPPLGSASCERRQVWCGLLVQVGPLSHTNDARRCPSAAGNAKKIQELRGLVASLEAAVGFTNAIAGAMPTLTQLLASSSVIDVQVTGYGNCMVFQAVLCQLLVLAAPLGCCQFQLCCHLPVALAQSRKCCLSAI